MKSPHPFAPARHPALAPTCYPRGAGFHVVILPEPEGFPVVLARQTRSWNLGGLSALRQRDVGIGELDVAVSEDELEDCCVARAAQRRAAAPSGCATAESAGGWTGSLFIDGLELI